ncbi:MAG: glycosyltransferase family 2 protein [Kiritimatiellae bacterium]|nr:glycosyltransferase family 2 protein [Kiritimatiellia bacterium]
MNDFQKTGPTASVIVPFLNAETTLADCLESLLRQTEIDFEVIAVDDGSTDGSLAVARAFAARDKRIQVLTHDHNRGLSAARNTGLECVSGTFLFFVDSDDVVLEHYLASGIAALRDSGADYGIAPYRLNNTDEQQPADSPVVPLKGTYRYSQAEEIRRDYLPKVIGYSFSDIWKWIRTGTHPYSRRECAGVWRCVYRREIVEREKIRFDESVHLFEDAMFNADYLLASRSMIDFPDAQYIYRVRNTGLVGTSHQQHWLIPNKLALLRHRNHLAAKYGDSIRSLYRGSTLLSLCEIIRAILLLRAPLGKNIHTLAIFLKEAVLPSG